MHTTQIGIFKIAQTRLNWSQVAKWLEFIGVKDVREVISQVCAPGILAGPMYDYAKPTEGSDRCTPGTDASALVALCGKRCYASFETGLNPNVSKIRTDHAEYITNVLKSGHGSVLEHATWSFAIENVSRVFTGEMNRHRAGVAISEASMRYIRFDDIGFTMPSSLILNPETDFEAEANEPDGSGPITKFLGDGEKKSTTQDILRDAMASSEKYYIDLCNLWKIEEMTDFTEKKKLTSMFRRIIGMGVATGGVWTINARALRHILAMRGSKHAEEEIFDVFDEIADIMIADEPLLFGDFTKDAEGSWVPKYLKV
jgi:thymidylate synthase (FAD)